MAITTVTKIECDRCTVVQFVEGGAENVEELEGWVHYKLEQANHFKEMKFLVCELCVTSMQRATWDYSSKDRPEWVDSAPEFEPKSTSAGYPELVIDPTIFEEKEAPTDGDSSYDDLPF